MSKGQQYKNHKLTINKLHSVWDAIPAAHWANLISYNHVDKQVVIDGETIKAQCPFHANDTQPSFFVTPSKRIGKCFGCNMSFFDPIDLYSSISNTPYEEAIREIVERYDLPLIKKSDIHQLEEMKKAYDTHDLLMRIMSDTLNDAIANNCEGDYAFAKNTVNYIRDTRKVSFIKEIMEIGILPPERMIISRIESYGLNNIYDRQVEVLELMNKVRDIRYIGQLVFAHRSFPNKISHFKLRVVAPPVTKTESQEILPQTEEWDTKKFIQFSHPKLGNVFSDFPTFFGLSGIQSYKKGSPIYIVEGEFDQMALATANLNSDDRECLFIATGGSAIKMDFSYLSNFGCSTVRVLFDDFESKGDEMALKSIYSSSDEYSLEIFDWECSDVLSNHLIKDPDASISTSENPQKVFNIFTEDKNYIPWHQFMERMIDLKIGPSLENDLELACKTFQKELIKFSSRDKARYLFNKYSEELNLQELDFILNVEAHTSSDSTKEFKLKVMALLRSRFLPVHFKSSDSDGMLVAWDLKKKTEINIPLASAARTTGTLCQVMGSPYDWITEHITIPASMQFNMQGQNMIPKSVLVIEKEVEAYAYQGLKTLSKYTSSPKSEDDKMRGGVFYLKDKDSDEKRWYIHNGKNLFVQDGEVNGKKTFSAVGIPVHEGHLFHLSDSEEDVWSQDIKNEFYLNDPNIFSMEETFDHVFNIIDNCFHFRGKLDSLIFALTCMYMPIYPLFERRLFLMIHGETSSGKSRLGSGIMGGKLSPDLHIVDMVSNLSSYTEAGLRQSAKNRNLGCTLDEFEEGESPSKTAIVRGIVETFRTGETKTEVVKGTIGGDAKRFKLDMPIIAMGIRPLENSADVNRFLTITTKKVSPYMDTTAQVRNLYPDRSMIPKIRQSTSLSSIRRSEDILKAYNTYLDMYKKGEIPTDIPYRTLSQILPLVSIYAVVKRDIQAGVDFIKDYVESYQESLSSLRTSSHANELWSEVLHIPFIKLSPEMNMGAIVRTLSLSDVLRDQTTIDYLRYSHVHGVSLIIGNEDDPTKRKVYILVDWKSFKFVLKKSSTEYRNFPANKLVEIASRDPGVVPWTSISGLIDHRNILRCQKGYSLIYDVTEYV